MRDNPQPVVTPLIPFPPLEGVWLKDETKQHSGAFKYRGAFSALQGLSAIEHLVTASTGNFGIALAMAGTSMGHRVTVFVPEGADVIKVAAIRAAGGQVEVAGRHLQDATVAAKQTAAEEGSCWLSGLDDRAVIQGYRTLFQEIFQALDDITQIFVPVGGGGMLAAAMMERQAGSKVVAVQCEAATSLSLSLAAGQIVPCKSSSTIAGGLAVPIIGETAFRLCSEAQKVEVVTVDDKEILKAMRSIWIATGIKVEPSGAVAVAAAAKQICGGKSVCILSGGNVTSIAHDSFVSA